jgi:protein AATF/BFR2
LIKNVQQAASQDAEKGRHTRNQLAVYDALLDLRIRSQRALNVSNGMPKCDIFGIYFSPENTVAEGGRETVKSALANLIHQLSDLQNALVQQTPATMTATLGDKATDLLTSVANLKRKRDTSDDDFVADAWRHQTILNNKILTPFRDAVIDKWHRRVSATGGMANKKLKALNQDVTVQVRQVLNADRERLVNRTRLSRNTGGKRIGAVLEPKEERKDDVVDEEIFDDNDYYSNLLRELIDSKIADTDDPLLLSMHWAKLKELQNRTKKHREGVDRKASKGRKLRCVLCALKGGIDGQIQCAGQVAALYGAD